jgi:hypothetical protein
MATIDFSTVHIAASFIAESGKAEKALSLALQFFDAGANAWTTLNTALNTEKGQLKKSTKLSARAAAVVALRGLSSGGALPPFRLVLEASLKQPVAIVAAQAPYMWYDAKTKALTLDFGNNFAQPAELAKTYLYNEAAASSGLYAALPAPTLLVQQQEKLQKENQQLVVQIAAADKKAQEATAQFQAVQAELAAMKKEMAVRDKLVGKMETEMDKARRQISEAESRLALSVQAVADKDEALQAATVNMEQQLQEMTLLREQVVTLNSTVSRNVETIQQLNEQVKAASLQREADARTIEGQRKEIQLLEEKITAMTQEVAEYKPVAQPVSKVYASILDEFSKTNELNKDGAYRLANISLNLKTFVEHDATGIRMQLVDANKLSSLPAAALSDFRVEIGEGTASGSGSVRLPDLLGLTETAARKIIHSLGLTLKPVYQLNKAVPDGQSFKQSPAAGQVAPGETITLVFSKHNS